MTRHRLPVTEAALHGVFSRDLPAVLEMDSGDEVELETLDAWWSKGRFEEEYGERAVVGGEAAMVGHALTGPISVRGLRPGETLEIGIEELVPAANGFTECGGGGWEHYARLGCGDGPRRMLLWDIDRAAGVATTRNTAVPRRVKIAPFLGVMGLALAAPGSHSTTPPRAMGGNLDCSLLTMGAKLFLPVGVDGGLLSVGDGHAAQGDGELSNNGIECAMERVRLRLTRRTDFAISGPVVRTAGENPAWVTLGLGAILDMAMYQAANRMLDLMCQRLECPRTEALGLMSVAVDFRVTQVVNGVKGVHAVWRDWEIL